MRFQCITIQELMVEDAHSILRKSNFFFEKMCKMYNIETKLVLL